MSRPKSRQRRPRNARQPRWWLGLLLLAAVAAAFAVWQAARPTAAAAVPLEISVAEAAAKREAGAFMLDVREPDEWAAGHILGATLIPLGELAGRVSELPRDQEIVVVCRSGNRSQTGRDILLEAGFEQVSSMAGGMNQWQALGFSTVSGP